MPEIKPDVIVAWPISFDYPRFREFLVEHRDYFSKIIISFTDTGMSADYKKQLRNIHPDFTFVDNEPSIDWFDGCITRALARSDNPWILFLEQDFICDDLTLKDLLDIGSRFNFACYKEGDRRHLCCFLTKRSLIDQTSKFFGLTQGSGLDNFDFFVHEMIAKFGGRSALLEDITHGKFHHLNGLTHNYRLCMDKSYTAVVRPDEFNAYNLESISASVKQIPEWLEIMKTIDRELNENTL